MCIMWHLFTLQCIPQHSPTLPHLFKEPRSLWSWTLSDMDLIEPYIKQSSANRCTAVCWSIMLGRSFIKHKKSKGPSMVPCATTEALGRQRSITIHCVLAVRKEYIQERSSPCLPRSSSFQRRCGWGTVLNALLKSNTATSNCSLPPTVSGHASKKYAHAFCMLYMLRIQGNCVDGRPSSKDDAKSGVPQQNHFSTAALSMLHQCLPSVVHRDTQVHLFAYDCLIYRSISSTEDQLKFQYDLHSLATWGLQWGMRFKHRQGPHLDSSGCTKLMGDSSSTLTRQHT